MTTEISLSAQLILDDGHEVKLYESSTPLAASAQFSTPITSAVREATDGAWIARGDLRQIVVACKSDKAGAANGARVEESMDGGSEDKVWAVPDTGGATTPSAGTLVQGVVNLTAPYFRVRYLNGATAQGEFALEAWGRK